MSEVQTLLSKKSTPARRPINGRVLAAENDAAVLLALSRYGFLTAAQLQALAWPMSTQPRVAQRTLKRLIEQKQALLQRSLGGAYFYCLTAAGARRLRALYEIEAVATTGALTSCAHVVEHRSFANDLCIWFETRSGNSAASVYTEHQIVTGKAILTKKTAHFGKTEGKVPDGLLLLPTIDDAAKGPIVPVVWCEVEMSKKRGKAHAHLVSELCHLLGGYGKERYATDKPGHEVHFAVVACPDEGHEMRLVQGVLTHLATSGWKRYNWSFVKNGVCVWRPNGQQMSLLEWLEEHPDVKAWDEALRAKHRENFDKS